MSERADACIHVATAAEPAGAAKVVVDVVSAAVSAATALIVLIISGQEDVDHSVFGCVQASSVRLEVHVVALTVCR